MTEIQKMIKKLKQIKDELTSLPESDLDTGRDRLTEIRRLMERIIHRVYPKEDAKQLKDSMYRSFFVTSMTEKSHEEKKADFTYDVGLTKKTVNTILEEYELFGFDDFNPIKEKTETEWQVGSNKFGYFKKKKTA